MNRTDHLLIADIVVRILRNEPVSDAMRQQLDSWLDEDAANRDWYERRLAEYRDGRHSLPEGPEFERYADFEATLAVRHRRRWLLPACAAALIALLCIPFGLKYHRGEPLPDSARAVLVLADGKRVELPTEPADGAVAGDARLERADATPTLSYRQQAEAPESAGPAPINRLIVPAGVDWKVALSDGTVVYMGAGSELSYPVRFGTGTREVTLRGKAYFDVEKGAAPFIVHTSRMEVVVHGTEFCVEDAGNRCMTTLVTGSVHVADGSGGNWQLSPGQQLRLVQGEASVGEVESLYFTAWKNGYFMYDNVPLGEILTDICGWYGLSCSDWTGGEDEQRLTCRISKHLGIEKTLELLSEVSGVRLDCRAESVVMSRF